MAIVAWSSGAARSAGSPLVKAEFRVKEKLSLRSEAKRSPPSMAPLPRIACFEKVKRGALVRRAIQGGNKKVKGGAGAPDSTEKPTTPWVHPMGL